MEHAPHDEHRSRPARVTEFLAGMARTGGITGEPLQSDVRRASGQPAQPRTIEETLGAAYGAIRDASLDAEQ